MSKQILDGGDLLVNCLLKEDISKIFGIVDGELLRTYDAIERWGREKGNNTVMVRHEQAGGHMADAWARATGGDWSMYGNCWTRSHSFNSCRCRC